MVYVGRPLKHFTITSTLGIMFTSTIEASALLKHLDIVLALEMRYMARLLKHFTRTSIVGVDSSTSVL